VALIPLRQFRHWYFFAASLPNAEWPMLKTAAPHRWLMTSQWAGLAVLWVGGRSWAGAQTRQRNVRQRRVAGTTPVSVAVLDVGVFYRQRPDSAGALGNCACRGVARA